MSNDYTLKFDLSTYGALDNFALLADQSYNLGDKGDWFTHFRWGLQGLYARVLGVQIHYCEVHSWELVESVVLSGIPYPMIEPHFYHMTEYHFSTILFNMDSAIECMVFTLNALGYAVNSTQFKDVTNEKELKRISPYNILGNPPDYSKGYDNYFPSLKSYWQENRDLIDKISEQHDVSKHRSIIFEGGRRRIDPPPNFFKKLGIQDDKSKQISLSAWAEISFTPQPKIPWRKRDHINYKDIDKLEDIAEKFCAFINNCGVKTLEDTQSNIKLKNYKPIK